MSKQQKQSKQQSSSELSKTLAGQLSKMEKRILIARSIRKDKEKIHQALKQLKKTQFLSR
jgi:hypothetical protein